MDILNSELSRKADKMTTEAGVSVFQLVESTALLLLKCIKTFFPRAKRVFVLSGKGLNGADGLSLARHLHLRGYDVAYMCVESSEKNAQFLKALESMKVKKADSPSGFDLIVDALLGVGFKPPLSDSYARLIKMVNSSNLPVLSVDLPSGLNPDSPEVENECIRATLTACVGALKPCHVFYPSASFCGKIVLISPGLINPEPIAKVLQPPPLPYRDPDAHKGLMGHALLVGASKGLSGALIISAKSCNKAGAGYVSVAFPEVLSEVFESTCIEELKLALPGDKLKDASPILESQDRYSAIGVGMGMGRYDGAKEFVRDILLIKRPLLLDADAINALSLLGPEALLKRDAPTVITPHLGEFERLSSIKVGEVKSNPLDHAKEFATRFGVYLVLKFSRTIIASPNGELFVSLRGSPSMAKAGIGDALSGIITSFLARGINPLDACKLGVFIHGFVGEIATKDQESLTPLSLINAIPEAFLVLREGRVLQSIEILDI
ncbi:MAG: NAD(P)H-hydrate dehydratase [Aquificaceae bacterium]|nr:NAD(P)H-hydrate dehydratase [Aquificaceae bacterium]